MIVPCMTEIVGDASTLTLLERPDYSREKGTPWHSLAALPFEHHGEDLVIQRKLEAIIPKRIGLFTWLKLFHRVLKVVAFCVNHLMEKKPTLSYWESKGRQF